MKNKKYLIYFSLFLLIPIIIKIGIYFNNENNKIEISYGTLTGELNGNISYWENQISNGHNHLHFGNKSDKWDIQIIWIDARNFLNLNDYGIGQYYWGLSKWQESLPSWGEASKEIQNNYLFNGGLLSKEIYRKSTINEILVKRISAPYFKNNLSKELKIQYTENGNEKTEIILQHNGFVYGELHDGIYHIVFTSKNKIISNREIFDNFINSISLNDTMLYN